MLGTIKAKNRIIPFLKDDCMFEIIFYLQIVCCKIINKRVGLRPDVYRAIQEVNIPNTR